jgi:hypothetical protein
MPTSSPNTKPARKRSGPAKRPSKQAPSAPSSFSDLTGDDGNGSIEKDEAKASLEEQLAASKDAHKEERFVWIVVTVMFIDVLWFRNASNPVIPIVVLLLQAVILFILANRLGVDEAKGLFERLILSITRSSGGGTQ